MSRRGRGGHGASLVTATPAVSRCTDGRRDESEYGHSSLPRAARGAVIAPAGERVSQKILYY